MSNHPHPVDPDRVARAREQALDGAEAVELRALLAVVGDPIRAQVLTALDSVEELCVGDIALALGVSEDAASYALRVLLDRGLVERRRAGRMGYYRLAEGPQRPPLVAAIEQLARLSRARAQDRPRP